MNVSVNVMEDLLILILRAIVAICCVMSISESFIVMLHIKDGRFLQSAVSLKSDRTGTEEES